MIVGTADDSLTKRGKTTSDNLVFEFALFLGGLGRRRTFLVVPEDAELDLPTDLDGLSLVKYDAAQVALGDRERLDVLQTVTLVLRNTMVEQLGRARAEQKERERKALASTCFAAMGRLQGAVIQLRDLLIELPTDALAALGDRPKFEHVKASGVRKVQGLYESWAPDARIVGVEIFEVLHANEDLMSPSIGLPPPSPETSSCAVFPQGSAGASWAQHDQDDRALCPPQPGCPQGRRAPLGPCRAARSRT